MTVTQYPLTNEEMVRACDELHSRVDEGPGHNADALADSLKTLKRLRSAASWDYPLTLLEQIELLLMHWFSGKLQRVTSRQTLLEHISRLEDAWERPQA
jgi:hypothetical protein